MVGSQIGQLFLDLAVNWSLAAFGVGCLMSVITGIVIFFNIGGKGVQQHVRSWVSGLFWGLLCTGAFQVIMRTLQSRMTFS